MRVCARVCTCVRACVCVHVRVYVRVRACVCVCVHGDALVSAMVKSPQAAMWVTNLPCSDDTACIESCIVVSPTPSWPLPFWPRVYTDQ